MLILNNRVFPYRAGRLRLTPILFLFALSLSSTKILFFGGIPPTRYPTTGKKVPLSTRLGPKT